MLKSVHKLLMLICIIGVLTVALTRQVSTVQAQDTAVKDVKIGSIVKGTITDDTYELNYKFNAKKGDLLVIQVAPDYSADKSLYSLEFRVSRDKKVVIDTAKFSDRYAGLNVSKDATYQLTVSRKDGKNGKAEDIGAFKLLISRVEALEVDKQFDAEIGEGLGYQFYSVAMDTPFVVNYKLDGTSGKYISLSLVSLEKTGELKTAAYSSGTLLVSALGIDPVVDTTYLMQVSSSETNMKFSLTVNEIK